MSIDLGLQQHADALLADRSGAIVLLNAQSGEILAIASHPSFDPNRLDEQATALIKDPQSPLLDRAAQELYPAGAAMQDWLLSIGLPANPTSGAVNQIYAGLGFYTTPDLRLPVAAAVKSGSPLRISPLQGALAAAAFSHAGLRPPARLAMAVKAPVQGWVVLPPLSQPIQALPSGLSDSAAQARRIANQPFWQWSGPAGTTGNPISWALAGSLPNAQGTPLAVVVLLEDANQQWAAYIGQQLLTATMQP